MPVFFQKIIINLFIKFYKQINANAIRYYSSVNFISFVIIKNIYSSCFFLPCMFFRGKPMPKSVKEPGYTTAPKGRLSKKFAGKPHPALKPRKMKSP